MSFINKIIGENCLEKICQLLEMKFGSDITSLSLKNDELTVCCTKPELLEILKFLRDDKQTLFRILIDVCGADYPEREKRFDVIYHLLSVHRNMRVRIKIGVAENDSVPSICGLFSNANWYERETYDMFGVKFENHPDLRRILTDYDFDGFPLRKDFPTEGKVEIYYDDDEKRVVYKKLDAPQPLRNFDTVSPWKGMTGNSKLSDDDAFDKKEFS